MAEGGTTTLLFAATALALLLLPPLCLLSGGPGWTEALAVGRVVVPALDLKMIVGATLCALAAACTLVARRVPAASSPHTFAGRMNSVLLAGLA